MNVVELKPEANGRQRVAEHLEYLLERAKRGEILGFAYVTYEERILGWGKINMTYPEVLGAFSRAMYNVNKEWDNAK